MKIEIKKSTKRIEYKEAIDFLEKRVVLVNEKKLKTKKSILNLIKNT